MRNNDYFCHMKQQEEITIQSLANNEDVQIGYSDNEIVIVDGFQQFTQLNTAHVAMNAVVICTNGKAQAQMNGRHMELHKNQVGIIPQNVTVTDVMISPDFDLKGEILFYTHFYDMITLAIERGKENPYHTEIIQALLRSAILGLCGAMKWMLANENHETHSNDSHFQRFLDLLHSTDVKHRTVEAYANDLYISPKYLTTICKKNSGRKHHAPANARALQLSS